MQGLLLAAVYFLALAVFPAHASAETANPPDPDYVNALWVAESGGVLKVATADGRILFEVGDASEIQTLAVDPRRGRLWTFAGGMLRAYGFDGALHFETPVPVAEEDNRHLGLVIDEETGTAWLGHHAQMHRIGASGELELTVELGAVFSGLTWDSEQRRLWVAVEDRLAAYDEEGRPAANIALNRQRPGAIEYDPHLKELWIATKDRLARYSTAGDRTFSARFRNVEHLAADGQGGLWFATGKVLRRTDSSGAVLFETEPFRGSRPSTIVDLAADPSDLSAWASTAKEIARADADGVISNRVDFRGRAGFGRIRATALYADTIPPELTITAPPADDFTNNDKPVFEFAHSDIGIGVDTGSFTLTANHQPLQMECTWTADSGTCVPVQPLPDGEYAIAGC